MITPVIINRLQWKAYLIFMITNLLFVPIFYFFYPETSNMSLEDLDYFFTSNENPVIVARRMHKQLGLVSDDRRPPLISGTDRADNKDAPTEGTTERVEKV